MKYVLVDREDNIIDKIELTREVSLSAAKTFFVGRKRIEEKEFDNKWRNIVDIITYQKMNDLPDLNTGITIEESNGNGDGCSFPFKQMVVDNEGDILPCCKMGGKKLVLGNIKDTTLRGAWNSSKMKELRYIHKNNKWRENSVCRRCILNK